MSLIPPRPRVIQVIESETRRGCGHLDGRCGWNFKHTHETMRIVIQYHTLDGEFLAERDHWQEEQDATSFASRTQLPKVAVP